MKIFRTLRNWNTAPQQKEWTINTCNMDESQTIYAEWQKADIKTVDHKILFMWILENKIWSKMTESRLVVSWERGKVKMGGRKELKGDPSSPCGRCIIMFIVFTVAKVS